MNKSYKITVNKKRYAFKIVSLENDPNYFGVHVFKNKTHWFGSVFKNNTEIFEIKTWIRNFINNKKQ